MTALLHRPAITSRCRAGKAREHTRPGLVTDPDRLLAGAPNDAVTSRAASPIETAEATGWVPRVLVVDDDEDIRVLLLALIESSRLALAVVGQAATGEEAIDRCRETSPDIVLLDQRMPGMSGLETAEAILRERPHQRIILFTAFLDDRTVRRAAELGIRACLPKGDMSLVPEALWKVAGS